MISRAEHEKGFITSRPDFGSCRDRPPNLVPTEIVRDLLFPARTAVHVLCPLDFASCRGQSRQKPFLKKNTLKE